MNTTSTINKKIEDFKANNYEYNGLWFNNDTSKDFANFIVNARNNNSRVEVTYKAGWENFSGYHGGNGLKHSFRVGASTGIFKIPLVIYKKNSYGGSGLLSSSQAVESYRIK